ncbi:HAD family phosphatase [Tsukamurella sp. 1534]|uniref:HAD family hydrolase n=1 Tax=Tsukamurella sp. 1534 TaxID=1151061 RepID=UPI0002E14A0F|nr:HAD-IB family hydrolase [Tsukamurella sp. 1534]
MSSTAPDEAPARRVAAFFDLDKTVIAKSSALAFSRPFFDEGLLNRRAVLKSSYAQFLMMLTAADHDQMERMRENLTQMAKGWNVEQVRSIVRETLHDVVNPLVFAEAAELIAGHHARGHDVVVVSASGEEMVRPIAELLGADHSVATVMAVEDGTYNGEIEFYCYGENKVTAMEKIAEQNGYDLDQCFAYSDSITDVPMLAAVGHPTAVNPDRGLRKEASERGWPVVSFSNPEPLRDRIPTPSRNSLLASAGLVALAAGAGVVTYVALQRKRA